MLSFTPDVDRALEWFAWTHELTEHGWRRTTLPSSGGLAQQDGRLMTLLEVVRREADDIARELQEQRDAKRKTHEWRSQREQAARLS